MVSHLLFMLLFTNAFCLYNFTSVNIQQLSSKGRKLDSFCISTLAMEYSEYQNIKKCLLS